MQLLQCVVANADIIFLCLQVVLKIIKHCQEEAAGGQDLVQGVLLGLVVDSRLEITNCFPFPRHNDEEDFDEGTVLIVLNFLRFVEHLEIVLG